MPYKARILVAVLALALTSVFAGGPAHGSGACAASIVGADWALYGHDLSNTRASADTGIDSAKAQALTPKWVVNTASIQGAGNINSTPTVSDGCVYFATDAGDVFALNADDGGVVWHKKYVVGQTRLGGVISSAVAIDNGLALINVSDAGKPFITAVNKLTGTEVWRKVVDTRPGSFINASPVPFNGMVFVGFAGDEYAPGSRGGYAIVRESDGALLKSNYTIPTADFNAGYQGGSVWSSAAIDPEAGYAFVGAGNPTSHDKEHQNTNAILKIDVDPARGTFGQIADAYKGVTDQYYPGLDRQPVCQANPDITYGDSWSLSCVQFDLDFGASPTLFTDARSNALVGAQQKAGVFHAMYASTMEQAWTALVGTPCFFCNASSPANDRGTIVAAGVQPGQVVGLNSETGGYRWVVPLVDVVHFQSVSIANGIAYALDFYGNINVMDSETGLPLLKRNMALDTGASVIANTSAGVSIARNTVYAPAAGFLIAYH
jgi:outer membrane protein assembly factor BamB